MRIFGIFALTILGVYLSIISVNGSLQDFSLVGVSPFGITGFAINILILFVGVATGVLLLSDYSDRATEYYNKYYALVEKHEKLKGQRDELRLDAIRNFDRIFQEIKALRKQKGLDLRTYSERNEEG
jgi:hypothetical protein